MPDTDLLAVGDDAIAWARRDAEPSLVERVAFAAIADRGQMQAALGAVIGSRRAPLQVVLADSLVKYFTVQPPLGMQRFEELRELASLRFEELFSTPALRWRISGDWNTRRPFLCCAASAELIEAIEAAAGRWLMSVAPIFVRRFNDIARRIPRHSVWIACRTGAWVTAACFEGGACHGVRSTALAARDDLARWLAHEALLANRPLRELWLADTADAPLAIEGAVVHRIPASAQRDLRLMTVLFESEVEA